MGDSTGTGADLQGDGSTQGVVPPGESKGESKTPGDEFVKKSQMIAALNSASGKVDVLTQQNADLQRQLNELRATQAKADAPKEVTRGELKRLVDGGDITQDQADALWDKQQAEKVKREASAVALETVNQRDRAQYVESQLSGYRALVPDAWAAGTAERAKVEREYNALVALGQPPTKVTEAAALRAAFGDLETLHAAKSARPGSSETHPETGGGRPSGGDQGGEGAPKGINSRQRAHYERLINTGVYSGWEEVKAELAGTRKAR